MRALLGMSRKVLDIWSRLPSSERALSPDTAGNCKRLRPLFVAERLKLSFASGSETEYFLDLHEGIGDI